MSLARPRGCYRARLTKRFRCGGPTTSSSPATNHRGARRGPALVHHIRIRSRSSGLRDDRIRVPRSLAPDRQPAAARVKGQAAMRSRRRASILVQSQAAIVIEHRPAHLDDRRTPAVTWVNRVRALAVEDATSLPRPSGQLATSAVAADSVSRRCRTSPPWPAGWCGRVVSLSSDRLAAPISTVCALGAARL